MTPYEIRIFRREQQVLIYSASLIGDHAATRRAQNLAQDGDHIEIWRGQDCIYTTREMAALAH